MLGSDGETPIFDEVLASFLANRQRTTPFVHAGGEPCHGCQSCLAEACDMDDQPEDSTRKQENGNTAVH